MSLFSVCINNLVKLGISFFIYNNIIYAGDTPIRSADDLIKAYETQKTEEESKHYKIESEKKLDIEKENSDKEEKADKAETQKRIQKKQKTVQQEKFNQQNSVDKAIAPLSEYLKYHVVVASTQNKNDAVARAQELKIKGYPSQVILSTRGVFGITLGYYSEIESILVKKNAQKRGDDAYILPPERYKETIFQ